MPDRSWTFHDGIVTWRSVARSVRQLLTITNVGTGHI